MGFLYRLIVNTGAAGVTSMAMHAESNAQALLAANELFPSCEVQVLSTRGHRQESISGSSDQLLDS
jgi:hypothetical protein